MAPIASARPTRDAPIAAMPILRRRARSTPLQQIAAAITLLAFAVLTSLAASHLHDGANPDSSCSICAAFGVGKLNGPTPSVAVPAPVVVTWFRQERPGAPSLAHNVVVVVLPPSCGPPVVA